MLAREADPTTTHQHRNPPKHSLKTELIAYAATSAPSRSAIVERAPGDCTEDATHGSTIDERATEPDDRWRLTLKLDVERFGEE